MTVMLAKRHGCDRKVNFLNIMYQCILLLLMAGLHSDAITLLGIHLRKHSLSVSEECNFDHLGT